jgi:hypothetical protein
LDGGDQIEIADSWPLTPSPMTWEPADEILAANDILDGGDKIEIADPRRWGAEAKIDVLVPTKNYKPRKSEELILCTRGKTLRTILSKFWASPAIHLMIKFMALLEVTQKDKTQKLRTEETRMERQELILLNSQSLLQENLQKSALNRK